MSFTPSFKRSDSFGKPSHIPSSNTSSTSKKSNQLFQHQLDIRINNKENLFLQIANKVSLFPDKLTTSCTEKTINYQQFTDKIRDLDSENDSLRKILKKSNYHTLLRADIQKSCIEDRSFCSDQQDLFLDSFLDSTQEKQFCSLNHSTLHKTSKKQSKRPNVIVQQIQSERTTKNLTNKYYQDQSKEQIPLDVRIKNQFLDYSSIQEAQQECVYKSSCEFYKDILLQVTTKDMVIFENLNTTIQKELDLNYKQNTDNYKLQTGFLQGLLDLLEKLVYYFEGKNPDKERIIETISDFKEVISQNKSLVNNLKILLIPVNPTNYEIVDQIEEQLKQANEQIQIAQQVIQMMGGENISLKDQLISQSVISVMSEENKILKEQLIVCKDQLISQSVIQVMSEENKTLKEQLIVCKDQLISQSVIQVMSEENKTLKEQLIVCTETISRQSQIDLKSLNLMEKSQNTQSQIYQNKSLVNNYQIVDQIQQQLKQANEQILISQQVIQMMGEENNSLKDQLISRSVMSEENKILIEQLKVFKETISHQSQTVLPPLKLTEKTQNTMSQIVIPSYHGQLQGKYLQDQNDTENQSKLMISFYKVKDRLYNSLDKNKRNKQKFANILLDFAVKFPRLQVMGIDTLSKLNLNDLHNEINISLKENYMNIQI